MSERECCFMPPSHCHSDDGAFCVDSLRRLVQLVVPALAGQREVTLWDMAALHIIACSVSESMPQNAVKCGDYDRWQDFCDCYGAKMDGEADASTK